MNNGTITITLEGVSFQDTERYRKMIHTLFERGVFNIRNGKAILNFDNDGDLAEIEAQVKTFRRDKPMAEVKRLEQFKVSMDNIDKSNVAVKI